MSDAATVAAPELSLKHALYAYLTSLALALFVFTPVAMYAGAGLAALGIHSVAVPATILVLSIVAHFTLGIRLSRRVLRRLVTWNHPYATITNVSSTKLSYVFFWPFLYPALFIRLAISRHL